MTARDNNSCQLVSWSQEHDEQTVQWLNDPAIRASFGITTDVTLESHRRWRTGQANLAAWAILADGRHCGNFLLDIHRRHNSAYLQIYIGEVSMQGQGLGRTAMSLALTEAFGPIGLHRVWLHTRTDNVRAQRLYSGLGFTPEGTERESIRSGSGYLSQQRWSLLATEWKRA